jgi:iron complex outermembrane recepter protein
MRPIKFKLNLVLCVYACAGLGQAVSAPTDGPTNAPVDPGSSPDVALPPVLPKIVVTGSRIARLDDEPATPTLILRRADIERTGASSVKELLDSLTGSSQVNSGPSRALSDATNGEALSAGASSVSLRHMGHQSTLVLLNSRRLAPFALDDAPGMFVNLDALPLQAIERIEVLRSGAAALYGSDAVAGVINIITQKNYQGVHLRATHEQSLASHKFSTRTASLTTGMGQLSTDRYHVLLNLELYKRSAVMWGDVLSQVNPETTRYSPNFGASSTYSHPGNLNLQALPGCPTEQISAGLCYYDRYARLRAQPAAERANLLLSGEAKLTSEVTGFTELLYACTQTSYLVPDPAFGFAPAATWFDPNTRQPRFFFGRGLPQQHPLNTTGIDDVDFRYRFIEADARTQVHSTNYRWLTGLRGTRSEFDWEAAAGAMGGTVRNSSHGFYSDSGFRKVIGDYTLPSDPQFFNRDYRIGQPNSPEVINALFPEFSVYAKNTLVFLDGKISGPLTTWHDRSIEMAAGFDLKRETLSIEPSANLLAGDIVANNAPQTQGRRIFGALFGELRVPITGTLEMQAAARLDKYPSLGANLSPKLGVRWQASPKVLWRGTVEGGFRAPNLSENQSSTRYTVENAIQDPRRCPQAKALSQSLRDTAQSLPENDPIRARNLAQADIVEAQECGLTLASVRNANPALKPEKSVASTLGLAFQPAAGYLASVDYWRIQRRNEIGYKTAQDFVNNENNLPAGSVNRLAPGNEVTFTPEQRLLYGVRDEPLSWISSQIENTSKTSTSGLDLSAQSRTLLSWGVLNTGMQTTYLIDYRRFSPLRAGYGDNLAGRYGYSRWRATLSGALTRGRFTNGLQLHLTSGTKLQGDFYDTLYSNEGCQQNGWALADCRIRGAGTLDYFFSYAQARKMSLKLQVKNVLNRRPPADIRAINEFGNNVVPQDTRDVQRRTVRLALEYKFL